MKRHDAYARLRPVTRTGKRRRTQKVARASRRPGRRSNWSAWCAPLVLIAIGTLAYINSFRGVFIFDDLDLPKNLSTQVLWPPWSALFGAANVNRPLIGLSLAINYAISGFDVWSYHLLNLMIHLLAGLALFGIVRRTLLNPRLSGRFGAHSTALALAIALIWLAHPLQTQSVTYIIQRGESLMGMFYLVTLYCVIRGAASPRSRLWYSAAVAACLGGMLSKQVMVTAPVVVLIYDFLFLSGSLKEALRKRRGLYSGLALTWAVLAATIIAAPRNPTAGFAVESISPLDYFKSEFSVIVHYIRLSIWPDALCLDYNWPKASSRLQIIPYALTVGTLEAATLWALWRRKPIAYLGVWFFGILSLTSSFMPFSDLAFEHRMYLSLAAVVGFVVLGGYVLLERLLFEGDSAAGERRVNPRSAIAVVAVTLVVSALCFLTIRRNADYRDGVRMWKDAISKRPNNPRARTNLGEFLAKQGNLDEAAQSFSEAIQIDPEYSLAHENIAMVFVQQGKLDDAIAHFSRAVELDPGSYESYTRLGAALANQQRIDEAMAAFSKAISISPDYGPALANLGFAQERRGKAEDAIASLNAALQHVGASDLCARIHLSLGNLMSARGDASGAAAHYREALRLKPDFLPAEQRLRQLFP